MTAKGLHNVVKVLDASTAHVTREMAAAIDAGTFPKTPIMMGEYGWLFTAPETDNLPEHFKDRGLDGAEYEPFRLVTQRAAELGCTYIMFDRDADVIEDLPVFDW